MIPSIDYWTIAWLVGSVTFFVRGARMDGRSPVLWGALSLGTWIVFTSFLLGGVLGGLVSQVLLFVALGLLEIKRERSTAERRRTR